MNVTFRSLPPSGVKYWDDCAVAQNHKNLKLKQVTGAYIRQKDTADNNGCQKCNVYTALSAPASF